MNEIDVLFLNSLARHILISYSFLIPRFLPLTPYSLPLTTDYRLLTNRQSVYSYPSKIRSDTLLYTAFL